MKNITLLLIATFQIFIGTSQTVFVNEIHYDNAGGDLDEGVEIAGPAGTDLTGYSIEFYNTTDSLVYKTTPLSGIIPAQDNGYGTINFLVVGIQNGPADALALIDGTGTVLQFLSYEGTLTALGGTAVGITSTDIGISQSSAPLNESLQLVGVGTVYTDFTWAAQTQTRDLVNTGQSFGGVLPPTVSFDVSTITLGEAAGGITVNINIANEDVNPTSADVVFGAASTASDGIDFTFTSSTTITFPGSSATQQTVSLNITDDILIETLETIVLELQNVTNGGIVGNNSTHTITIIDNDAPIIPACSEIFFSEYMEGSSNNKALEIFNPTTQVVDLSNYEIRSFGNGSPTVTGSFNPTGVVVPGDVFVIANSQAQLSILQQADATSGVINFNGNDAVQLVNLSTGEVIDVIGEVGVNPGTEWIVGTGSTLNNTLVRMSSIDAGTSAWTGVGDTQWEAWGLDDTLHIGSHQNIGCVTVLPLTAYPVIVSDTICIWDTIYFTNSTYGGTTPYTSVLWDFGDGNTSTLDNPYSAYTSGGSYTVTLTVTDGLSVVDDSVFTIFVSQATADFSFSGEPTVSFTNLSAGTGNSYSWDFGDGNTSTAANPTNTYASNGTFTVCLSVTSPYGCQDSICQSVLVTGVGVNENNLNTVSIYPNPTSNNQITVENEKNDLLSISISNIIGQNVWSGTIRKTETINLPDLQKGNYFVNISSDKGSVTKKLIVQ